MRIIIKDCEDMSIIIEGIDKIVNDATGVTLLVLMYGLWLMVMSL